MVRRIQVDNQLRTPGNYSSSVVPEEEMIRASPVEDKWDITPVQLVHKGDGSDVTMSSPPVYRSSSQYQDVYYYDAEDDDDDDEFPALRRSGPPLLPEFSNDDDDDDLSTPSPTGVDNELYPTYDDYGRIQLVPKSYVLMQQSMDSPDISLVDLISEISEEECAELNNGHDDEEEEEREGLHNILLMPQLESRSDGNSVSSNNQELGQQHNRDNNNPTTTMTPNMSIPKQQPLLRRRTRDEDAEECKDDNKDEVTPTDDHEYSNKSTKVIVALAKNGAFHDGTHDPQTTMTTTTTTPASTCADSTAMEWFQRLFSCRSTP